jgi:hypothetical protein
MTMRTQSRIISIAMFGLLVFSIAAARWDTASSSTSSAAGSAPDACSLLTAADASKALEVASVSSKRIVAADPSGCVWSDDPDASDTSRRVLLVTHSPVAFKAASHPAITTIKVEPVSGIGDEAFY